MPTIRSKYNTAGSPPVAAADLVVGELAVDTLNGRLYTAHTGDVLTEIGLNPSGSVSITGNIAVSGTVDGRDVATDGTKLDTVETSADVTDTANVTSSGALMDSEVSSLSGVKTLTVPDSTTISAFGADLVDDASASAARTTLELIIGTDVQAYDATILVDADISSTVAKAAVETAYTGQTVYSASDTLVLTDAGEAVYGSNASAMTITVPPQSSVAWAANTRVDVFQEGAGQITITAGAGVTLRSSASGGLKTTDQYSAVSLVRHASDEWYVIGGVA